MTDDAACLLLPCHLRHTAFVLQTSAAGGTMRVVVRRAGRSGAAGAPAPGRVSAPASGSAHFDGETTATVANAVSEEATRSHKELNRVSER